MFIPKLIDTVFIKVSKERTYYTEKIKDGVYEEITSLLATCQKISGLAICSTIGLDNFTFVARYSSFIRL